MIEHVVMRMLENSVQGLPLTVVSLCATLSLLSVFHVVGQTEEQLSAFQAAWCSGEAERCYGTRKNGLEYRDGCSLQNEAFFPSVPKPTNTSFVRDVF